MAARLAHIQKVGGSTPSPATIYMKYLIRQQEQEQEPQQKALFIMSLSSIGKTSGFQPEK